MKHGFRISGTLELTSAFEYIDKVKSVQNANLIDLWPLFDAPITTVAVDQINVARNGTYVNSPVLQSELFVDGVNRAPLFLTASSQRVTLPAAAINAVFSRLEGTLLLWVNMYPQTTAFLPFATIRVDVNNLIQLDNFGSIPQWRWIWIGSATTLIRTLDLVKDDNWLPMVITWSTTGNRMRAYFKGSQVGTDLTPLPAWAVGALTSALLASDGTDFHTGNLAMAALWTKELTPTEVLTISTIP